MQFQKGDFVRLTEYGLALLRQNTGFLAIGWDGVSPVPIDEIGEEEGIACAILRWKDIDDDDEADDAEIAIGFDWLEAVPLPSQIN